MLAKRLKNHNASRTDDDEVISLSEQVEGADESKRLFLNVNANGLALFADLEEAEKPHGLLHARGRLDTLQGWDAS